MRASRRQIFSVSDKSFTSPQETVHFTVRTEHGEGADYTVTDAVRVMTEIIGMIEEGHKVQIVQVYSIPPIDPLGQNTTSSLPWGGQHVV